MLGVIVISIVPLRTFLDQEKFLPVVFSNTFTFTVLDAVQYLAS
mgnify:CR=1 FL=1